MKGEEYDSLQWDIISSHTHTTLKDVTRDLFFAFVANVKNNYDTLKTYA